jgi:hypothetical protein
MSDYTVSYEGSLYLLNANNPGALSNMRTNVGDEAQWLGNAVAVEPRYIADLVWQLREEGWEVD